MPDGIFLPETGFPPELDHISANSLKMAVRCEEQWRQRYILNKLAPPSLAMLAGKADHAAIEKTMRTKIDTGDHLGLGEVRAAFLDSLEGEVEIYGGIDELEIRGEETKAGRLRAYDTERRQGQLLVGEYHGRVSPTIEPIAVEEEFSHRVKGLPVELIGRIDLIGDTGGERRIIDRKRSGRARSKPEPEWVMQGEIYQLVSPYPHEWHQSISKGTARVLTASTHPDLLMQVAPAQRVERQISFLVAKLGWLYTTYGPDNPWPATGKLHPWACGYCGFRPDCWAWKGA